MAAATGAAAPDSARLRSQRRRQHESMGKVSEWIADIPALAYAPEIEEEIVTVDVGEEAEEHPCWAADLQHDLPCSAS